MRRILAVLSLCLSFLAVSAGSASAIEALDQGPAPRGPGDLHEIRVDAMSGAMSRDGCSFFKSSGCTSADLLIRSIPASMNAEYNDQCQAVNVYRSGAAVKATCSLQDGGASGTPKPGRIPNVPTFDSCGFWSVIQNVDGDRFWYRDTANNYVAYSIREINLRASNHRHTSTGDLWTLTLTLVGLYTDQDAGVTYRATFTLSGTASAPGKDCAGQDGDPTNDVVSSIDFALAGHATVQPAAVVGGGGGGGVYVN